MLQNKIYANSNVISYLLIIFQFEWDYINSKLALVFVEEKIACCVIGVIDINYNDGKTFFYFESL